MEHIYNCLPQEGWNHIYTDCSAEYALRNYGVGVYMQYLGGSEDKTSLATMCSTNFKIEAKALRTEAAHAERRTKTLKQCHQKTNNWKTYHPPWPSEEQTQSFCSGYFPIATELALSPQILAQEGTRK